VREIKFRAWDKKLKSMMEVRTWCLYEGTLHCIGKSNDGFLESSEEEHNYEIMQFTGLHDKNGKEIYEGDIVKVKFSNSYETFEVVWQENKMRFGLRQRDHDEQDSWAFTPQNDFEIIGNIYEDPELLKN